MQVFSVSELTFAIKSLLEPRFRSISVRGEISNLKIQSSGHLYFSLKDSGAQLSAVLFKGNASSLSRPPKEGDQVVAMGEIGLYAPRGQYQMVVRELQFQGVGALLLKLQQLKETLSARGWFDPAKKKSLPKFPKRIGVITSPTGAVIQDILNVLNRRFSGFHLILNPVKVQGEGAALEIAQAIFDCNRYSLADVLIVGRGGGSIEDLWAFNEEIVAKAIFESEIPIVSAVGHETDFTIADFVADVRAPTPSAAAELVVAEKSNLLKFLEQTGHHLRTRIAHQVGFYRQTLQALQKHPLFSSPYALLSPLIQSTDAMREALDQAMKRILTQERLQLSSQAMRLKTLQPSSQIHQLKEQLKPYPERLFCAFEQLLKAKQERLQRVAEHLHSVNPQNLLQKGYTLLFTDEGKLIQSAKELTPHQSFTALLRDGRIVAEANQIEYHGTTLL